MSTFRVKNNYSDGYVDENGFVRRNIHEVVKEIEKKIDMIDPNADNNEFITKVENHMNAVNQTVMNQNMNIDNINMQLNQVIEPKLNNLETIVNFPEGGYLIDLETSKTNGSTGNKMYETEKTRFPVRNLQDISSYHMQQRSHDSTIIKDLLKRVNNMSTDDTVTIKKSDWEKYHNSSGVQVDGYSNHQTRSYEIMNPDASNLRESYKFIEPLPSDFNTLSEYLACLSAELFTQVEQLWLCVCDLQHKVWDSENSNIRVINNVKWWDYLTDKPDEKYLDI